MLSLTGRVKLKWNSQELCVLLPATEYSEICVNISYLPRLTCDVWRTHLTVTIANLLESMSTL